MLAQSSYAQGLLLDVGCGKKPFHDAFQGAVNCYVGMDIPSKIDRSDKAERAVSIDVYGSALYLPIKSDAVDTVLSTFTLEHIYEYSLYFSEIYRVLKQGGHFYLIAPLMNVVHEAPYDYFRYTENAIKLIAEEHHSSPVLIIPLGGETLFWGNRLASKILQKACPFSL